MENQDKIKITLQDILAIISIIASAHIFTSLYYLNSIASKNGLSSFSIYSWEDVLILNYKVNIPLLIYPFLGLLVLLCFYVIKHCDKLKISLPLNKWTTISLITLIVLDIMFLFFLTLCTSLNQEKNIYLTLCIYFISLTFALLLYSTNTITTKTAIIILTILSSLVPIISIKQFFKQNPDRTDSNIEFFYNSIGSGVEKINCDSLNYTFIISTSKGFVFSDTNQTIYFYENERISNLKITTEEKNNK